MSAIIELQDQPIEIKFSGEPFSRPNISTIIIPSVAEIDAHFEDIERKKFLVYSQFPPVTVLKLEQSKQYEEFITESLFGLGVLGLNGLSDKYNYYGEVAPGYLKYILNLAEKNWGWTITNFAKWGTAQSGFDFLQITRNMVKKEVLRIK